MQRGFVSTLPISEKSARERASLPEIASKAARGRSSLEVWANAAEWFAAGLAIEAVDLELPAIWLAMKRHQMRL